MIYRSYQGNLSVFTFAKVLVSGKPTQTGSQDLDSAGMRKVWLPHKEKKIVSISLAKKSLWQKKATWKKQYLLKIYNISYFIIILWIFYWTLWIGKHVETIAAMFNVFKALLFFPSPPYKKDQWNLNFQVGIWPELFQEPQL